VRRSRSLVVVSTLTAVAWACAPATKTNGSGRDPLLVDAVALKRIDPKSALKIVRGPFNYFRYTNRPFVDLVCAQYAATIATMPMVHAHGDAHLEQYAVAAEGRGLADYDASAVGPPVVDLARFATSVVLASPNDERAARAAITALLTGYRKALEDPTATAPEPAVAARLRGRFEATTLAWLDNTQRLIVPTSPEDQATYDAGWRDFFTEMRTRDPALAPGFFRIKVGGHLDMGVGSSHAEKFLVRIEGPSASPEDDLILEAKALEPGALGSCMRGADLDATRVIKGQAQLSNAPQRFLAAVKIHGKPFYSHTWLVHYRELSTSDIASSAELSELAYDVGVQLGRGHAKQEDEARVPQQRRELAKAVDVIAANLASTSIELAGKVTRAWTAYREQLPP
jgi:uncharacterized protein (DUF2252 family)